MANIMQFTDLNEICITHSFASALLSLHLITFFMFFNLVYVTLLAAGACLS